MNIEEAMWWVKNAPEQKHQINSDGLKKIHPFNPRWIKIDAVGLPHEELLHVVDDSGRKFKINIEWVI